MMIKILHTYFVLALLCSSLFVLESTLNSKVALGQDVHFSQNYATPLYLNPALTGIMNGDLRVSAVYRNQWNGLNPGSPYRTLYASADMAFRGAGLYDRVSVGLMLYNDRAGDVGYQTNYGDFSLAYNLALAKSTYISLGIEGGIAHRSYDLSQAEFGSTFTGTGFDSTIPNGEAIYSSQTVVSNLGAGVLFYTALDDRTNIYAGGGMFHVTKPNISFYEEIGVVESLSSKLSIQVGGSTPIGSRWDVVPSAYLIKQGTATKIDAGSFLRYIIATNRYTKLDKAFNIGAWLRVASNLDRQLEPNAIIAAAKLDYENVSLGLSYDVPMGSITTFGGSNNTIEIALVYNVQLRSEPLAPMACPKF